MGEILTAGGIMLDKANKPRVLFLVEEAITENGPALRWWEPGMSFIKTVSDDALTLHMKNKGFEVTAHRAVFQDPASPNSEEAAPAFSHEEAIRLGRYFDADFVVTGRATATRLSNTMGEEKSFNGTIDVTFCAISVSRAVGAPKAVPFAIVPSSASTTLGGACPRMSGPYAPM